MRFKKRRAARIRNELRQWLRSEYGVRTQYSRAQLDRGREELGFGGVDDPLIANTLFGSDLVPAFADSMGLSVSADDISEIIGAASDLAEDAAELLVDN